MQRALCSILALVGLLACSSKRDDGPGPAAGNEIAEVKQLVAGLRDVKDMNGMVEVMSNETAASFGLFIASFVGLGVGVGDSLTEPGDAGKPPSAAKLERELEALFKKYGLGTADDPDAALKIVSPRGRPFLRDVIAIVPDWKNKEDPTDDLKDLEDADYRVVGPRRVEIVRKGKPGQSIEARWEDGRWRLHLGILQPR